MANDMSHLKPAIENLDGTNYQSWKRDMQMVLSFWFQALVAEMRSLFDKGTFELTSASDIPPGRKALATKWVFDMKRDIKGSIIKFKSLYGLCQAGKSWYEVLNTTLKHLASRELRMIVPCGIRHMRYQLIKVVVMP